MIVLGVGTPCDTDFSILGQARKPESNPYYNNKMTNNLSTFFQQLELTRDYSPDEIARLVKMVEVKSFSTGEPIIIEGGENDSFFFLYEGEAEVLKFDKESEADFLINIMSRGALFGEMSELTGEPVSATVRAKNNCKVLAFSRRVAMPHELYVKLLLSCSRNLIRRLKLLSERQADMLGREAKRERDRLQKSLDERDRSLADRTDELKQARQHLTDLYLQQYEIDPAQSFGPMVGSSSLMRNIFALIKDLAQTTTTVLITGETGTGKGLIAAAIHQFSDRKREAFISVNCVALSDELLASELFGHKKGAYTGAIEDRVGRFKMAQGGTIFLDEIGDISPRMQAYLLRILETGEYERLGESKTLKSDVRVIAATNRDLKQRVVEGSFREDLYYRLNVMNIEAPPLRNRKEDVPLLLDHFREHFNRKFNRRVESFSPEALKILTANNWRGNVRELRNVIERAMILCPESILQPRHLPSEITSNTSAINGQSASAVTAHSAPLKHKDGIEVEKTLNRQSILQALRNSVWNVSDAARALGVSRTHLHRLITKYSISRGE